MALSKYMLPLLAALIVRINSKLIDGSLTKKEKDRAEYGIEMHVTEDDPLDYEVKYLKDTYKGTLKHTLPGVKDPVYELFCYHLSVSYYVIDNKRLYYCHVSHILNFTPPKCYEIEFNKEFSCNARKHQENNRMDKEISPTKCECCCKDESNWFSILKNILVMIAAVSLTIASSIFLIEKWIEFNIRNGARGQYV